MNTRLSNTVANVSRNGPSRWIARLLGYFLLIVLSIASPTPLEAVQPHFPDNMWDTIDASVEETAVESPQPVTDVQWLSDVSVVGKLFADVKFDSGETGRLVHVHSNDTPMNADRMTSPRQQIEPLIDPSLQFAEPLDLNLWRTIQWTVVVLTIAGVATVAYRRKLNPILPDQPTTQLCQLATLPVGQRGVLHLIGHAENRFLVATDSSGVKSVTVLPQWIVEEEEIADTSDDKSMTPSEALANEFAGLTKSQFSIWPFASK